MKIKAWDKERKQYIPQEDFAITGDGRLLIQLNEYILLYPSGIPSGHYAETDGITIDDVGITVIAEGAEDMIDEWHN